MDTKTIDLKDTNYFSSLMLDYIDQKECLKPFYNRFPTQNNFIQQAADKLKNYTNRKVLVDAIGEQMKNLDLSKKQKKNLLLLEANNSVTITTGHQLNLFTGPIFFFYKILQVIKQTKELNKAQSDINFLPVFWMATEDHDFDEINHFRFGDRIIHWEKEHGGPVGKLTTKGLEEVFNSFLSILPNGIKKEQLKTLINSSYLKETTLADATRTLVHLLFKEYGLLILDGDDKSLKELMIPSFEKELITNTSYKAVDSQSNNLKALDYTIQVNPREINLFYISHPLSRERIIFENDKFHVLNTAINFTKDEILEELKTSPEKFSPNVILRPLYQETILPNVAYVGGGGELAYWLELKTMFEEYNVDFPLLVLRNSMLIRTKKQTEKQLALNLKEEDLFNSSHTILKNEVIENSNLMNQLPEVEKKLHGIFDALETMAHQTDKTFLNMVQAQKTKQLKGFHQLQKRLIKAEIKKNDDRKNRIENLLADLSQEKGLQERIRNFSDFEFVNLDVFIASVYNSIKPFEFNFIINTLDQDI